MFSKLAATFLLGTVFATAFVGIHATELLESTRPQEAWTLDEALAQLQLHPRDSYFQYVALQLARRKGPDELKRVARMILMRDRWGQRRRGAGRAENLDLFKMTTGALAVQESLQLDAMADLETAAAEINRENSRRVFRGSPIAQQNLRQLGLALHNYHDVFNRFPTPASYDDQGKPLLSWRVHILPYLGQAELYDRFELNKPWDSPVNKKLIAQMPDVYRTPADMKDSQVKTRYVVPVGDATLFVGDKRLGFRDVKDGSANTVMIVEAAPSKAVIWTKPDDFSFRAAAPASGLAGVQDGWLNVTMSDGSVRSLPSTMEPKLLAALYTRDGGEEIDWTAVYARLPSKTAQREPARSPITLLAGPTVRSHPFKEMLAGQTPAISSLAMSVPEDFYYIRFRRTSKLLELADKADLWAAHVFSQSAQHARSHQSTERLKTQLCVVTSELLAPFYDLVVTETVIAGSDLFFRQGCDVTFLFRYTNETVFRNQMDQFLENAVNQNPQVRRSTGSYRDVPYVHLTTPDRRIHVFSAYPEPGLHIRSNSRVALERIIDTQKRSPLAEDDDSPQPLGQSHEFQYMRTLFEKDAAEEDAFVYLSDPFIRQLVGPVKKITVRRRLLCYNHLRMLGHADLLYRTEHGKSATSLEQLREARCLPPDFGEGRLACPDHGEYRLSPGTSEGICSVHGRAAMMTPCCETPATEVTATEYSLYRSFLREYNAYWRTFFDPIGIRIQLQPKTYRLETIVLPLLDNSIYSSMARVLGGEPVPLDRLPVAQRDIFSMAVKFDKSQLIQLDADEPKPYQLINNLRQIGLAFHNFHDVHKRFPPALEKNSGLSWRVHLLPFVEQQHLYTKFHIDEPWDSPHNKKLLDSMPPVYGDKGTKTRMLGFSGEDAPMGRPQGIRIRDVRDGTSNTLLVVHAGQDRAVPWTKPEDLVHKPEDPLTALGQIGQQGISALMMDGSVHTLPPDITAARLRALITHRGGETVDSPQRTTERRPGPLLNPHAIEHFLSEMGVLEEDSGGLGIAQFLTRGIGDEISFHMCDAEPTFSFSLPRFLGTVMGRSGGRIDDDLFVPLILISSIDAPIYLSTPVQDEVIVDRFLEQMDGVLARLSRTSMEDGFLTVETDFYHLPDVSQQVRCFSIGAMGLRFRFFVGRFGESLYIASQPFVLQDLAQRSATELKPRAEQPADEHGHFLMRLRPENWDRVLQDYRLGWAEGNRRSCLNNLGPLTGLARAYDLPIEKLLDVAGQLHGVRYFCPEGGQYHWVPVEADSNNAGPGSVCCTIHGSAGQPRQQMSPSGQSKIDGLLAELKGVTAALTFTEEGLRAVLRIERQPAGR